MPGRADLASILRDQADAALGLTPDLRLWILVTTARRETKVSAWIEEIDEESLSL